MRRMEKLSDLPQFTEVFATNLPVDKVAEAFLPPDLRSLFRAIPATGDGNCLFNATSIALVGNENLTKELRLRTAYHIMMNKQHYDHSVNSKNYEWYNITDEIIFSLTDRCWGGPVQLLALAQILNRNIVCFDCHYSRDLSGKCNLTTCLQRHQGLHMKYMTPHPRSVPLYLLFTSTFQSAKSGNHFVPLLRITTDPFPNLKSLKNEMIFSLLPRLDYVTHL